MLNTNLSECLLRLILARGGCSHIFATCFINLLNEDFIHVITTNTKRILASNLGICYTLIKSILGAVGKRSNLAMLLRCWKILPSVLARTKVMLGLTFAPLNSQVEITATF